MPRNVSPLRNPGLAQRNANRGRVGLSGDVVDGHFFGNIVGRLYTLRTRLLIAEAQIAERFAREAVDHMKSEAPWTDRTGQARSGLDAEVSHLGTRVTITLFYSVAYGVWLEVAHGGEYAIIGPTIDELGPQFMEEFDGLLGRL